MKKTLDSRGLRWRGLGVTALLLAAVVLPACNDTTTNIPNIPRALVVVTVDPNPVIGLQNTLTGRVSAAYVVTIREAAGLGGQINFVNSTVFDPSTGLQVTVNYFDSADLKVFVGTDRVGANGELKVAQTTSYVLPDFKVAANLTVNVQVADDQGTLINQSTLLPIVPPEI